MLQYFATMSITYCYIYGNFSVENRHSLMVQIAASAKQRTMTKSPLDEEHQTLDTSTFEHCVLFCSSYFHSQHFIFKLCPGVSFRLLHSIVINSQIYNPKHHNKGVVTIIPRWPQMAPHGRFIFGLPTLDNYR